MKRVLIAWLMILILTMGYLSGCSQNENDDPLATEKDVVIRLGYLPEVDSIDDLAAKTFQEYVEKESNGTIKVNLYPGGQLGSETEMTEQCKMGTTEMIAVGEISAIDVVPEFATVLRLPYIFDSYEHLIRYLSEPMGSTGKTIPELITERSDIHTLNYYSRGSRQLTANKPIYSVDDLKGVKLRVPSIAISVDSWKLTGAVPTSVEAGELYLALQQGLVEAQENPVDFIKSKSLNEVQKYLMKTNHQYGMRWIMINETFYQSLSENQRNIIEEGSKLYSETGDKLLIEIEGDIQNDLIKNGMTLIETKDIDIESIKNFILSDIKNLSKDWDPSVIDAVEKTR